MRLKHWLLVGTVAVLLTSCGSAVQNNALQNQLSANDYLQLAASNIGAERNTYRLQAAEKLLNDHQLKQAEPILDNLNATLLSPVQANQLNLLKAEYLIYTHRPEKAVRVMRVLPTANLTPAQQQLKHDLMAQAYAIDGNQIAQIDQLTALLALKTNDDERHAVIARIWDVVQHISSARLDHYLTTSSSIYLKGWLSLAKLSNQLYPNNQALQTAITTWKQTYPNHPGEQIVQSSNQVLPLPQMPQHLALLLPLTGPLGHAGQAIRNGFFSAYYAAQKQGVKPVVKVYDTTKLGVLDAYQQALSEGAQMIVGPLQKSNIQSLLQNETISVPTLMLNNVTDNGTANVYQFGLSPSHNAVRVADRAWQNGHTQALIIAPSNAWGQAISKAFMQEFTAQGGTIVGQLNYDSDARLSPQISDLMGVSSSYHREHQIAAIVAPNKLRFIPRRRKDFDMVFVVALPQTGREILPLLRFYFADNVPFYSVSAIYQGSANPQRDHDLNGVIFQLMPWLLNANKNLSPQLLKLQNDAHSLWPHLYRQYPQLFAFGVDAYQSVYRLDQLAEFPQLSVLGATGKLYLNGQTISRHLPWAQMRYGVPHQIR